MAGIGFFSTEEDPLSYEGSQRRRKVAEALMQQGMSTAPIQSWTEGAARLAQALVGKMQADKVDKADASNSKLLASLLSGGSAPSMSAPSPASGAAPTPSTAMTTADATGQPNYRDAIASIESRGSGDYSAVGTTHPKYGRALGRYQVMEANIGPWSEAALGRRVSADEFMKDPKLQDAIFDHKFAEYVKQYGNPQDAASAWFTGRPLAQGANARDSLGTTGAGYVEKFNAALAGGAPVQVAQAGGATAYAPQALAQALNPQARAPQAQPSPQMAQAAPQQGAPDIARLQGILMDPRFSPQQKQMAVQLFQLGQKQEPQWEKLNDGTLYDKRTGRTMSAGGPAFRMLTDAAERQRLGIPADDRRPYQIGADGRVSSVGGAQTTVNIDQKAETAFETEAAKAQAKRFNEAIEGAQKAQSMMGDIQTMREISDRVGSIGANANTMVALGPMAEALGINIQGLPDVQAFESIIQRLAPQMRATGSGSTSDVEFKGFLASLPRLSSNPQARNVILDTMEANARYNIAQGEIASRVFNKEITKTQGEQMLRELGNPMEAFRQFKKANPDLFASQQPKQPTPEELKQRAIEELRRRNAL